MVDSIAEIESTGQAVIDPCKHCRTTGITCFMHPMHRDFGYRKCLNCLRNLRSCEGTGGEFRSVDALRSRVGVCSAITFIADEAVLLSSSEGKSLLAGHLDSVIGLYFVALELVPTHKATANAIKPSSTVSPLTIAPPQV